MRRRPGLVAPVLVALLGFAAPALAQDATTPGAPEAPHPTFHNIGISWPIDGDDDADGVVAVRWRVAGGDFRAAIPLFRVPAGGTTEGYTWGNRHAGSVFGLEPATTYEVELTLTDPDGGDVVETLEVTTRTWPEAAAGARTIDVDPDTLADALAGAAPGDVLVLADGTYGETVVTVDGEIDQPIVLRAATPLGPVFEGDIRLDGRSHVIVEGMLVHGKFKFNDATGIVVRGNRIETPDDGVVAYATGVRDALVVDNVVLGPTAWAETSLGVDGDNLGEGVQLTGPGNVIAFNRIEGFRDCISLLEGDLAFEQFSIDVFGNDMAVCADDGVEADFAMGNVRVYQNRITDSFMGISSQPSLGGPSYFVRNVLFDVLYQPFKLQRESTGDVLLHNTSVKSGDAFSVFTSTPITRAWGRNNLFLGAPGRVYQAGADDYDSGDGQVAYLPTADASCSFDHDGFGAIGVDSFEGEIGDASFTSLAELRANTTEVNAIEVDLSIFAGEVAAPADAFADLEVPSMELAAGSAPIDAGEAIAGVNDGFTGDAPDLGAYELGQELPVYGPEGHLGSGTGAGSGGGAGTGSGSGGGGPGSGAGGEGSGAGAPSGGNTVGGNGAGATAGAGIVGSGGSGADAADDTGDDGCGCSTPGGAGTSRLALLLLGGVAAAVRTRRRHRAA